MNGQEREREINRKRELMKGEEAKRQDSGEGQGFG